MELIDKRAALACFRDWTDRKGNIHEADEMPEYQAIERLPAIAILTPCDACAYNPPSSFDGKPCTMCPAERRSE